MNLSAITSFDGDFDLLSINTIFEAEKFEPEPIFEKTINEIKENNLEIIVSSEIILLNITLFDKNLEQLSMDSIIKVSKSEPEPTLKRLLMRSKLII